MGRRKKAAKKVAKKKRPTVARTFKCLFCNHEDVVSCRLDMKSMTGEYAISNCLNCYDGKTLDGSYESRVVNRAPAMIDHAKAKRRMIQHRKHNP